VKRWRLHAESVWIGSQTSRGGNIDSGVDVRLGLARYARV